ncbi:MAG TPA: hypothetical protein VFW05_13310 [Verrucomicrobiae bacterium]|nr:hypothetical protein [Verrucomicrobiae bacterium]
MPRIVQPELLDILPPNDPKALGSRQDLLRLNRIMGHVKIIAQQLDTLPAAKPFQLIDLGGSDGAFLLEVAEKLGRRNPAALVQATLMDRSPVMPPDMIERFAKLNWQLRSVTADALDFLRDAFAEVDVMIVNLLLHQFDDEALRELLALASQRTRRFIAVEPERGGVPGFLSGLIGLIGCNSVTRHDARVSVEAGFCGHELTAFWPRGPHWEIEEHRVGWVNHLFIAQKK